MKIPIDMNRLTCLLGVLSILAAGCDREPCSLCTDEGTPRHLRLDLSGSKPETRAFNVSSQAEDHVAECRLYVFGRNGELVDSYRSDDGRFDFYLTDEIYDFIAVANKDDLPEERVSKSELLARPTSLAENAVGRFVMAGRLDNHLIDADEKITLEMQRLVGKVSYVIRTAFTGSLATASFIVEEIYLTNVAGENVLSLADSLPASGAAWYNRMDLEPGGPTDLLYGHVGYRLEASDSLVSGHCFYPYPNVSADSHDKEQWGSRCTRFVVKATLDGRTTYYPVTLPAVRANRHYHVDLTVANYGLEHPEDNPADYAGFRIAVSVASWGEGGSLEGNY